MTWLFTNFAGWFVWAIELVMVSLITVKTFLRWKLPSVKNPAGKNATLSISGNGFDHLVWVYPNKSVTILKGCDKFTVWVSTKSHLDGCGKCYLVNCAKHIIIAGRLR